jgi:phosphocarrier protein
MLVERKIVINNRSGLHARPAALFVQTASRFKSNITVRKGKQKANGKSIMGILALAAGKGSRVSILAQGEDAELAVGELERLLVGGEE